jgi:hypothetical protein
LTSRTSGSAGSYRGGEAGRERRASERTPRVGRTYHIRQISRRTSNCRHATSRHITSRSTAYKANHSRHIRIRILIALSYPIPVPMPDQTCSKRPQSMHSCRHSYPIHRRESRSAWPRPRPRSSQGKASHLIASSYLAASSRLESSHSDRPATHQRQQTSSPQDQRRSQTHLFAAVAGTRGTAAVGASATSSSAARHLGSSVCWGGWVE